VTAKHKHVSVRLTAVDVFSDEIQVSEGRRIHFSVIELRAAVSATIAVDGERYEVGDKVTLVGGSLMGAPAVFNVDSAGSIGEILGVTLDSSGDYAVIPSNPVPVTPIPAGGSQASLTVTFAAAYVGQSVLQIKFGENMPWHNWFLPTADTPQEDSSLVTVTDCWIRVGSLVHTGGVGLVEARVSKARAF